MRHIKLGPKEQMKQNTKHLRNLIPNAASFLVVLCSMFIIADAHSASVSGRATPSRAKVTTAARTPTTKTTTDTTTVSDKGTTTKPTKTTCEAIGGSWRASTKRCRCTDNEGETITTDNLEDCAPLTEETFEFENKTDLFDEAIGASDTSASGATSDSDLADIIRKQRDAQNAADATSTAQNTVRKSGATGKNACDDGLRKCMQSKCGADFTKCAGDTDTAWGDKMDLCRIELKCSGHEYQLFATEIKADRDTNAELANFNKIIDCGNRYNTCIINECGTKFSKCLGKSAGDAAIAKCKKIQTECTQMDNGLASRMMNVFATLRQDAEKQIQRDEQRLYDLRDEMEKTCRRLGAMFDQRSLDCVYTINFLADNNTTPYATKKAYAGGTFDCDPGWFGIDITTFKENAYRETISQKSASAAMLGSGVGMAAGAITSGAIDRALDTQKAKKALNEAEKGDDKADKKTSKDMDKDEKQSYAQPSKQTNKDDKKTQTNKSTEQQQNHHEENQKKFAEKINKQDAETQPKTIDDYAKKQAEQQVTKPVPAMKTAAEIEAERAARKAQAANASSGTTTTQSTDPGN